MSDTSTTEAISAAQIVGDSYLEMLKAQSAAILASANISFSKSLSEHSTSAIEKIVGSASQHGKEMLSKFMEMNTPIELAQKHIDSIDLLVNNAVAEIKDKAINAMKF